MPLNLGELKQVASTRLSLKEYHLSDFKCLSYVLGPMFLSTVRGAPLELGDSARHALWHRKLSSRELSNVVGIV